MEPHDRLREIVLYNRIQERSGMPITSRHAPMVRRPSDPKGSPTFLWSLSWPELELTQVGMGAPCVLKTSEPFAPAADQPWARLVQLPSQMTEHTLMTMLAQAGWCEFEVGLTLQDLELPQALHCRAVLARDVDGGLKLDGVASLQVACRSEQTPLDESHPRLSDMAFATITMNPSGIVTGWHGALRQSLGVTEPEAIGEHIGSLFTFCGLMLMPGASSATTIRGFLNGETALAAKAGQRVVLQRVMRQNKTTKALVLVTVIGSDAARGAKLSNPPEIEEIADPLLLVDREAFQIVRASIGAHRTLLPYSIDGLPLPLAAFSEDLSSALSDQELYLANGAAVYARCHFTNRSGELSTAIAQVRGEPQDPMLYVALRTIHPAPPP